jgi:MoaA/NifB/PqqE/SkfB family radical SAM enzyme
MNSKSYITSKALNEAYRYIEKDPVNNFGKLILWAKKLPLNASTRKQILSIEEIWNTDDSSGHMLITKLLTEIHPNIRKKLFFNFLVNSGVSGSKKLEKSRKKNNCNIPWAILMDPTSACNLKCLGCWAADYSKTDSLGFDTLNRIINQGKKLGTYFYLYSGGEPLIRKDDIIKLARIHNDCFFLTFTNGTLITEKFAEQIIDVGNISFALSVEGFESDTDMRRGDGTYKKIIDAMAIFRKYKIAFGFSSVYHNKNEDIISSEEYFDFMIDQGALFGWFFTYIPIGKDAHLELLATAEQREHMYHKIREYRKSKPLFTIDFWNDGEYVGGCIAGGRRYIHINANGDVEPCAFIHYSNVNIKNTSLLDSLKQPIFMKYKEGQPFNNNMLRPCPLLDNPDSLEKMVKDSGAHSTQPIDKESVSDLTNKTRLASENWAPVARKLWTESHCADCKNKNHM